nr:MAG TPA: hypothetical protein [Caudoviricetes sp.]
MCHYQIPLFSLLSCEVRLLYHILNQKSIPYL